jgi:hypothetical protein
MNRFILHIILLFAFYGCIEPFEFETRDAEGILVVQATITDELKKHTIVLSRAANLENVNIAVRDSLNVTETFVPTINERVNPELSATVILIDNQGNEFLFEDAGKGLYESSEAFALGENKAYSLQILTTNNETYESDFESLAGKSKINNIYAERNFNKNGQEGITIFTDGADATGNSDYFRYSFQETYQIIAPQYSFLELEIIREELEFDDDENPLYPDLKTVRRMEEERVCYNSESSSVINLASTNSLTSSNLERHVVRFLNRDNTIISHRYSILITQYVMNSEAYNYYQNLSNFAQSESVFSEIQPGFLEGNMKRTNSDNGLVLGYFEVASVAKERYFFNYEDFFPNEDLPPYFGGINCDRLIAPSIGNPLRDGPQPLGCLHPPTLIARIIAEELNYFGINENPGECEGPYLMVPSICSDCTIFGSNVKPEFWID